MAVDDAYTVALLHMNGSDGSTTFTDESGKSWTAAANAQIDTAQSKFGGASGLFDGTGDYISAPDSADWQLDGGSNSNSWTVDMWIRFASDPSATAAPIVQQYVDASNYWAAFFAVDRLYFRIRSGGTNIVDFSQAWSAAANQWYHLALVKDGTNGYTFYVDGTKLTTNTDTDTMPDFNGALYLGRVITTATYYLDGWIDEVRISKGIARWTADFTPPTSEYTPPAGSNFFF